MEWEGVRHQFQPDCRPLEKRFDASDTSLLGNCVVSTFIFFQKETKINYNSLVQKNTLISLIDYSGTTWNNNFKRLWS